MNKIDFKKIIQRLKDQDPTLTELNFGYMRLEYLRRSQVKILCKALELNTTLKKLYIGTSLMRDGDRFSRSIAEALKINTSLEELTLSLSGIGDTGAQRFAEALASNSSLKKLNISSGFISDTGALALANALKTNESLKNLDVSEHEIGITGILALNEIEGISMRTNSQQKPSTLFWCINWLFNLIPNLIDSAIEAYDYMYDKIFESKVNTKATSNEEKEAPDSGFNNSVASQPKLRTSREITTAFYHQKKVRFTDIDDKGDLHESFVTSVGGTTKPASPKNAGF